MNLGGVDETEYVDPLVSTDKRSKTSSTRGMVDSDFFSPHLLVIAAIGKYHTYFVTVDNA